MTRLIRCDKLSASCNNVIGRYWTYVWINYLGMFGLWMNLIGMSNGVFFQWLCSGDIWWYFGDIAIYTFDIRNVINMSILVASDLFFPCSASQALLSPVPPAARHGICANQFASIGAAMPCSLAKKCRHFAVHSGKLAWLWKITIFNGYINHNTQFLKALLDYQRVYPPAVACGKAVKYFR